MSTDVHHKRALDPGTKLSTHATKITAIRAIGGLPETETRAQKVVERYLRHHPVLFTLHDALSTGLHETLETGRARANDMLQESHYQGNMNRNIIQHHKC